MIDIQNVEKSIKGNKVLDNISCIMEDGKVYGLYGRNGSGKTMLMRCILGLIHTDSGCVLVDEREIGKEIDFPESVGAIIETPGFFPYATGYENLKMLADIRGLITEEEVREAIRRVGLDDKDKRTVSKYSLGMKQRLAIAQAVMEHPKILVLDEPTNALDEEGVELFRRLICEEVRRGTLIILASHNKEDIEILSDVKIQMSDGRIKSIAENEKEEGKND